VLFVEGQDSATVTLTGVWDFVQEPDETVILTIDAARADRVVRYGVGSPSADTAIIVDFTVLATVKATPGSMTEDSDTARFVIQRNDATGACIIYFCITGTAVPDSDYVAVVDSVVMADGQVSADVLIASIRDFRIEPTKTVVLTIEESRADRVLRYSAGKPAEATISIKNYVEPFTLVPHAMNNPYQVGVSPVPPYVRALPGITQDQGVVIATGTTPRIQDEVTLTGKLSIYDVVKNPVIEDLNMVFDMATKCLYYVWNGRNVNGRAVAPGTYLAIIKISNNLNKTETKRIRIGVKR